MQQAFFRCTRLLGDPPRPAAGACGVAGVTHSPFRWARHRSLTANAGFSAVRRTATVASDAIVRNRCAGRGRRGRIFYILALSQKKIHVWTLKNFNVIFGPSARRHRQWRRGNTARRHRLWRRGACCAGTNGCRGIDVAPSSAP
jgi:hypothetical protein